RRLAERLLKDHPREAEVWGGISPDVVEAAALAHDLGHPPFGHIAEEELNHLVSTELGKPKKAGGKPKPVEGYEGNAQSFRIVTSLAVRRGADPGLDLTRATLNATLKYPWKFCENPDKPKKYGAYECDDEAVRFARKISVPVKKPQLVDCHPWFDGLLVSDRGLGHPPRTGRQPRARAVARGAVARGVSRPVRTGRRGGIPQPLSAFQADRLSGRGTELAGAVAGPVRPGRLATATGGEDRRRGRRGQAAAGRAPGMTPRPGYSLPC